MLNVTYRVFFLLNFMLFTFVKYRMLFLLFGLFDDYLLFVLFGLPKDQRFHFLNDYLRPFLHITHLIELSLDFSFDLSINLFVHNSWMDL